MKLKNLPIGESSFEKIIERNFLYVDKTKTLYKLITENDYYFLSRPRRFGKSLLVSTLKNIFLGNKDLFKGLWIYNSDYEWKKYPVIVIDFNNIMQNNSEELKKGICRELDKIAMEYEVKLKESVYKYKFDELILKLSKKYQEKVVVLIDEYDKPIISHIGEGERRVNIAKENREILKSFFGTLKGESVIRNLRFVLLTGVSKFSKAGVFSELNNLADITLTSKYSDLLGITDEEIDVYLKNYLKECADELSINIEKLKKMIKDFYNGYRFSRKRNYVYNPFSLINFFSEKEFKNYWFESGTPTFLVKLIKEKNFYLPRAEELIVDESIFSSYELERLNPESLLFQTGYLTIKDYDFETNEYVLSYPNKEVKYSFLKILYREYVSTDEENLYLEAGRKLREGDVEGFIEIAKRIFSGIAYSVGSRLNEANFHTIFYLLVNAAGTPANMELLTSDGRIDMVVNIKDKLYIMEFKCNQKSEKAIDQIKNKYLPRFINSKPTTIILGINFDTTTRNIKDYNYEIIDSKKC